MQDDAVSNADDRQPFHRVNGKTMTQSEWREQLRDATEVFEIFKRSAYIAHEI